MADRHHQLHLVAQRALRRGVERAVELLQAEVDAGRRLGHHRESQPLRAAQALRHSSQPGSEEPPSSPCTPSSVRSNPIERRAGPTISTAGDVS